MKYLILLLLSVMFASTTFAEPPSDAKAIQGTWIPAKAELNGVPMKTYFLATTILKLNDGKYVVTSGGKDDQGTYLLDADSKPKTMDISGIEGPNAGKKILCIYELEADTLKICYALGGGPRPTDFKSTSENKRFLVTYERKQP